MTERSVVITGAAGGVGQALVDEFRGNGWKVIGTDVKNRPEQLVVDDWVQGDLSTTSTREALHNTVGSVLSAVINNAAVQFNSSFRMTTEEELLRSFEVNVLAGALLVRDLGDPLSRSAGAIVNVGTVHSVATSANVFPYSFSKSALLGFTRSVAIEMAAEQVRCNAVLLGAVDTPMLRDGFARRQHPDGADGNRRDLIEKTPLKKIASPQEVAPAVRFFADSTLSGFVTGQCLLVDGGVSVKLASE